MVRPKVSFLPLKPSKTGDSTIKNITHKGVLRMLDVTTRTHLKPSPVFWELFSFIVVNFWPTTSSHGCFPGREWWDRARLLLHPSWSRVGSHRLSRTCPNLAILRPLLGPGGVARRLPPCPRPLGWEETGTPGWGCPTGHRSRSPPI